MEWKKKICGSEFLMKPTPNNFEPIFDIDSLFVDQHRRIRLHQYRLHFFLRDVPKNLPTLIELFSGIFEPIFDVDSLFVDQHRRIRLQQYGNPNLSNLCINPNSPDYIQESECSSSTPTTAIWSSATSSSRQQTFLLMGQTSFCSNW